MHRFAVGFWEAVKTIGSMASIMMFILIVSLLVIALTHEEADLFPSPLEYLDANVTRMGEFYYEPDKPAYCPGETVTWTTNAYNVRSTAISVSYYLQSQHLYKFVGPNAKALEAQFPGEKFEVVSLYQDLNQTAFHNREGAYIGGIRSFTIPPREAMEGGGNLMAGDQLRLYVELDAPFSRGSGYFVEWKMAEGCR